MTVKDFARGVASEAVQNAESWGLPINELQVHAIADARRVAVRVTDPGLTCDGEPALVATGSMTLADAPDHADVIAREIATQMMTLHAINTCLDAVRMRA